MAAGLRDIMRVQGGDGLKSAWQVESGSANVNYFTAAAAALIIDVVVSLDFYQ